MSAVVDRSRAGARRMSLVLMLAAATGLGGRAEARGVTPYLPLNMSPEIERQIERVLILADEPVLTRPIPAARVWDALEKACSQDERLCRQVRQYLDGLTPRAGIAHASADLAWASQSAVATPNGRGMPTDANWSASGAAFWRPSDYVLVSAGGDTWDGGGNWSGSLLSVGYEYAQLDAGFREHWWSPMTDSSMLISTQAKTMPSFTLSNYTPISRVGLRYEVFLAQMYRQDGIYYEGERVSGKPLLFGVNLSIEPVAGWTLGVNRVLQYGGGPRDTSLSGLFDAFFRPTKVDNVNPDLSFDDQFGNQTASFISRVIFPGRNPFSVYMQYAGEDGSRSEGWRLGNVSLSAGIDFPRLWDRFDLTYEISDWQNGWYVHPLYQEGLSNEGNVIGHWGADFRVFGDGVGAQGQSLRVGWDPESGGRVEARYRMLHNEDYSPYDYQTAHEVSLRYSAPWRGNLAGIDAVVGRDVFGEDYQRVGAFVRFGDALAAPSGGSVTRNSGAQDPSDATDVFVDAGATYGSLTYDPSDNVNEKVTTTTSGAHLALGARRAVSARSDLGARIEFDQVDGSSLLGVRLLDYRYRFGNAFAMTAFAGAARYDLATAAYGYYGGIGAQWMNILPRTDLAIDLRFMDKTARDQLTPDDPPTVWGDYVHTLRAASVYLSYRF